MSTAMVLVDYALADLATPTPEPQAVTQELPIDLAESSHPVRAALVHGVALREVLAAQLPADHAGHADWPALRRWLSNLDDDRILGLLEFGVHAVITHDQPVDPDDRDGPDDPDAGLPPRAVGGLRGTLDALRRNGVTVLEAWGVDNASERAAELLDAASMRGSLLALLDAIWDLWLERAWREQLPLLRAAADTAPTPPPGCGAAQWISLVTGLRPDPVYAETVGQARRLSLMPCPGLGRSLSLFADDDRTWVLYSPQRATATSTDDPRRDRSGIAVGRFAPLAPTMHALGDRTRLAIVLHLLEHGPLTMQQLIDALQVHQSTISRQVATLRKAGLVDQLESDDPRRIEVRREPLRNACRTLQDALD
jgi:DNA-binding transcriptional ArsR family regulator